MKDPVTQAETESASAAPATETEEATAAAPAVATSEIAAPADTDATAELDSRDADATATPAATGQDEPAANVEATATPADATAELDSRDVEETDTTTPPQPSGFEAKIRAEAEEVLDAHFDTITALYDFRLAPDLVKELKVQHNQLEKLLQTLVPSLRSD
jgi:hypothetical protein